MKISPIEVTLVDSMGSDLSVVNAARVSFDKESDWDVVDIGAPIGIKQLNDPDTKLLRYLATHNHWSPFSHAFASFRIKAPIFVARQLVKHTVGLAWNEVSRRYVSSEPEFYLPDYWRKSASNVKQGSSDEPVTQWRETIGWHKDAAGEPVANQFSYHSGEGHKINDHVAWQCRDALIVYDDLLASGVCAEQARMILPQNTMTEWIWSGSLYAFARVCNLRLDNHSQKETQEVAKQISNYMKEQFPESWKVLVAE